MTVANGRQFLSIPGPTNVPDAVLAAMQRPAIDIYSGEMIGITDSCLADLKTLFNTKGRTYIYAANGHGGWEAALTNVLSRGDTVLALESGRFAIGWGEMAKMMGVEVEVLKGDWRRAVDPGRGRGAPQARQGPHDQGRAGRADRYGLGRRQRHPRHPQGDGRGQASGPADGRLRGLARLHGLRHGRLGRRRRHVGLAEGPDDAAGARLRRRQRQGPRRAQDGRPAHALLGLDLPRGRDPLPEVLRHAARAPAVRPAQGHRHAEGGGPGPRHPPARAAGRGDAGGRGQVGRGPGAGASTSPTRPSGPTPSPAS